jgi:nucleoside-diphosphate-sugar epimerase
VPALAEWLHTMRAPVILDTTRARTLLGWTPEFTTSQTLDALARSSDVGAP